MDAQPPRPPLARRVSTTTRRAVAVLGAVMVGTLGSAAPATAVADEGTSQASQPAAFAAEAWFRPALTCDSPVGCLPVSVPSGYPEGTLHVGVLAGQEESRSYVSLRLPTAGIQGGTLTLPVAAAADGTVQAASAKLRACLVTGVVKDKVAGDMTRAPSPDCTVSSPAVAKTSGADTTLTVDLAPFAVEWSGGQIGSLALVPADAPATTDSWHLAFSRHDRTGAGVLPLSATFLVAADAQPAAPVDETPTQGPLVSAPQLPVATLEPPVSSVVVPGPVVNVSAVPGPAVAQPTGLVPAAVEGVDTSFAYAGVFLLPPLVLLAAAWVARALTRDLTEEQA